MRVAGVRGTARVPPLGKRMQETPGQYIVGRIFGNGGTSCLSLDKHRGQTGYQPFFLQFFPAGSRVKVLGERERRREKQRTEGYEREKSRDERRKEEKQHVYHGRSTAASTLWKSNTFRCLQSCMVGRRGCTEKARSGMSKA